MTYDHVDPEAWKGPHFDTYEERFVRIRFPGDGRVILEDAHMGEPYHEYDEAEFAAEADGFVEATPEEVADGAPNELDIRIRQGLSIARRLGRVFGVVVVILLLTLVVGAGYVVVADTITMHADPAYIPAEEAAANGFDTPRNSHDTLHTTLPVGEPPTEVELSVSTSQTARSGDDGSVDVTVASIPDAQLGPVSANPLRYLPAGLLVEQLHGDVQLDRVGSVSTTVDGRERSLVEYDVSLPADDPNHDPDAARGMYLGRYADDGDLLVVLIMYEGPDEDLRSEAFGLLEDLERSV